MTTLPNYWYDATVSVRVYLNGYPGDVDPEDIELEIQGLIDGAKLPGVMLSCHGTELGDVSGFEEEVPDA